MRKGFTMIELIFVIVILGILATIAIPRLAASREDAEAVKTARAMSVLVSDIASYYTSQAKVETTAANFSKMTNVKLDAGEILSANKKCVKVEVKEGTNTTPPYIVFSNGADAATEAICKRIVANSAVAGMINAKFTPEGGTETTGIAIGSTTSIKF